MTEGRGRGDTFDGLTGLPQTGLPARIIPRKPPTVRGGRTAPTPSNAENRAESSEAKRSDPARQSRASALGHGSICGSAGGGISSPGVLLDHLSQYLRSPQIEACELRNPISVKAIVAMNAIPEVRKLFVDPVRETIVVDVIDQGPKLREV